jgi:DNA-binding GntR family transcriptional regulator
VRRGDLDAHIRIDLEFHRLTLERGGNRRLERVLQTLQDQIRIVFRTSATVPGRMVRAVEEHRRILAALTVGDPDLAEVAARAHVRTIREAVMAYVREGDTSVRLPERGEQV